MRKMLLLSFLTLCFCLPAKSQTLTLKRVELDKRNRSGYPGSNLIEGYLELEFGVHNNTKDTLYLFMKAFDPLVAQDPFQVVQSQKAPARPTDTCQEAFTGDRIPSPPSYRNFDTARYIVKILPAKTADLYMREPVTAGFCPETGRKIEVCVTYKLNLTPVDPAPELAKIRNGEAALKILEQQQAVFDSNAIIRRNTELLRQLKESIRSLKAQNRYAVERLEEAAYLKSLPFVKKELKSNSVFVNEK